ncbi:MAG: tRNA glutamyl-Q(34) synthetase GluQRS [Gammaproteobacteria bacterium]
MGTTADAQPGEASPGTPDVSYRGRFAPSPTGPLHFGSLLAAAGSWLDARAAGGEWLLRIEDLDPPREPPGAIDEILRTLEAFGLWWDGVVVLQSHRLPLYEAALDQLGAAGWAYPCTCSRKRIEAANRERGRPGDRSYPGTCRTLPAAAARKTRILRVRTTPEPMAIVDRLQGSFQQSLEREVGDFVLRRREGFIAYQLAVVVDDALQGITDVVRGTDLLDSTPRQVWLQRLLDYPTPRYMHLPIVIAPGGEKLSKQTGAAAVDARCADELGWRILAALGQAPPPELRGAAPAELWAWAVPHWRPQQLGGIRNIPAP